MTDIREVEELRASYEALREACVIIPDDNPAGVFLRCLLCGAERCLEDRDHYYGGGNLTHKDDCALSTHDTAYRQHLSEFLDDEADHIEDKTSTRTNDTPGTANAWPGRREGSSVEGDRIEGGTA